MERKNFIDKLRDYRERIRDWNQFKTDKKGTQFNKEQNTVIKFVAPLLNILKWDVLSKEVEFEYLNPSGGRADIALYINGKPQILIEVKPIQNKFKKEWPTKIFDYMSKAKIKYGIETNGDEVTLYDNYRVKSNCKRGSKLFSIRSDDFITYSVVLWLLSKDMVEKGELDRFATAFHRTNDNFYKWRESRKRPRDSNYNEYTLRLEFAKEFCLK